MRTRIAGGLFPATLRVPGRVTTLKKKRRSETGVYFVGCRPEEGGAKDLHPESAVRILRNESRTTLLTNHLPQRLQLLLPFWDES